MTDYYHACNVLSSRQPMNSVRKLVISKSTNGKFANVLVAY